MASSTTSASTSASTTASTGPGSNRRIGAVDSKSRARLLDVAERLLMTEGYAAVTSRRVGQEAGVSSQLVHYYFRSMDELFIEVFRRRADTGFARFERALADEASLRTIWAAQSGSNAVFSIEFAALANHRKSIRDEMAAYAERYRTMQVDAIERVLEDRDDVPAGMTAEVVLVAITGIAQVIALEQALGVSGGHDATLAFIHGLLDS